MLSRTLAPGGGPNTLPRRSSVPGHHGQAPEPATLPRDIAEVSPTASRKGPGWLGLAAASAVLAMAGTAAVAPPAMAQSVVSEYQLIQETDGQIVVHFGQADKVVNPADGSVYTVAGAGERANQKEDKTLCQQAEELGGRCLDPILIELPGGLQIEQIGPGAIWAGTVSLEKEREGVFLQRPAGDLLLFHDGSEKAL